MKRTLFFAMLLAFITFTFYGCGNSELPEEKPTSSSGVQKATTVVKTNTAGHTVEQEGIMERYKRDNAFGSIKHLYLLSAYSGQCIIYSTVRGKVISSGKRLTPHTVVDVSGQYTEDSYGFPINIGGKSYRTTEVLQDDGTYGSSIEYLYWFDSKDIYHQQYVTGGMILHVSDQPMPIKSVVINMELNNEK